MKNKLFYKFLFIFFVLIFNLNLVNADEFNFNVTEIEILNNGNLYKGLNRGSVETDDGIVINANTFIYNKITNIVEAEGKVKVEDRINNYEIYSDKATYLKNEAIQIAFSQKIHKDNSAHSLHLAESSALKMMSK